MTTRYFATNDTPDPGQFFHVLVTSSESDKFRMIGRTTDSQNYGRWIRDFEDFTQALRDMGWYEIHPCKFRKLHKHLTGRKYVPKDGL